MAAVSSSQVAPMTVALSASRDSSRSRPPRLLSSWWAASVLPWAAICAALNSSARSGRSSSSSSLSSEPDGDARKPTDVSGRNGICSFNLTSLGSRTVAPPFAGQLLAWYNESRDGNYVPRHGSGAHGRRLYAGVHMSAAAEFLPGVGAAPSDQRGAVSRLCGARRRGQREAAGDVPSLPVAEAAQALHGLDAAVAAAAEEQQRRRLAAQPVAELVGQAAQRHAAGGAAAGAGGRRRRVFIGLAHIDQLGVGMLLEEGVEGGGVELKSG